MNKSLLFAVTSAACLSAAALDLAPPTCASKPAVADQRLQTATQFGFVVPAGADLSVGGKAYKIARFARLFYIGYALSQNAPDDVRAEALRRSLGSNDASWGDLWQAAKDMVAGAAGQGPGSVNLLFDPIGDLADPEAQYERMLKDKDFVPCASLILGGLLSNLAAVQTSQQPSWPDAMTGSTGAVVSGNAGFSGGSTLTGAPADPSSQEATQYLSNLYESLKRGEVDMDFVMSEVQRLMPQAAAEYRAAFRAASPEQQQQARTENAERLKKMRTEITCRDCRGTGWGPPLHTGIIGDGTRLEYCKGCGGIATNDHRHDLCPACHGIGRRRPFLNELD